MRHWKISETIISTVISLASFIFQRLSSFYLSKLTFIGFCLLVVVEEGRCFWGNGGRVKSITVCPASGNCVKCCSCEILTEVKSGSLIELFEGYLISFHRVFAGGR